MNPPAPAPLAASGPFPVPAAASVFAGFPAVGSSGPGAVVPQLSLLDRITAVVALVVAVALVVSVLIVVGPRRTRRTLASLRGRLVDRLPAIALLLAFMAVMRVAQRLGTELSWVVGANITDLLYAIEGNLVPTIQSFATPAATVYFAAVYVFGFAYLLAFPFIAYTAIPDPRPFRETVVAFVGNYVGGLLGYTLFIAYGPRNHLPDLVESLLFTNWPAIYVFTAPVTANSNVFPSLHTSFSVTVALLAWRTRDRFPRWTVIAVLLAASIVVATMYLGIHWATDVVAGLVLAVVSVRIASRDPLAGRGEWLQSAAEAALDRVVRAVQSARG